MIHPTDSLIGMDEEEVLSYIYKRKGMIDALVLSGGEPTLQKGMAEFIEKAKSTGILIKLDTNGSRPDVIKDLLDRRLLDFVAMDIKAPFHSLCKSSAFRQTKARSMKAYESLWIKRRLRVSHHRFTV